MRPMKAASEMFRSSPDEMTRPWSVMPSRNFPMDGQKKLLGIVDMISKLEFLYLLIVLSKLTTSHVQLFKDE